MKTINIHDAKTNLSRLIEEAVRGEDFVIARAGKPMVRVSAIGDTRPQRLGFLEGEATVPKDFDDMGADTIADAFEGRV